MVRNSDYSSSNLTAINILYIKKRKPAFEKNINKDLKPMGKLNRNVSFRVLS